MHKYSGLFIVFEGPEGSGKTTQIQLLQTSLEESGFNVVITREPGGTNLGHSIRDLLLNPNHTDMHPITETFLFHAARAQHVAEIIRPALQAGKIVISDRFQASSDAYQGVARNLGLSMIKDLGKIAGLGISPDVTIYLDIDVVQGLARKSSQGEAENNRMEAEELDFHQRVRAAYLEFAENEEEKWVVVDASQDVKSVAEKVVTAVLSRIHMHLDEIAQVFRTTT